MDWWVCRFPVDSACNWVNIALRSARAFEQRGNGWSIIHGRVIGEVRVDNVHRGSPRRGPAHHEPVRGLEALRVVPVLGSGSAAEGDQVVVQMFSLRRNVLMERTHASTSHPVASCDLVRRMLVARSKIDQLAHCVRLPEIQDVVVEIMVAQLDTGLAAIRVLSNHLWIETTDPHQCITFRITGDDIWWDRKTLPRANLHLVMHLAVA
jgi:hypothetical protein